MKHLVCGEREKYPEKLNWRSNGEVGCDEAGQGGEAVSLQVRVGDDVVQGLITQLLNIIMLY